MRLLVAGVGVADGLDLVGQIWVLGEPPLAFEVLNTGSVLHGIRVEDLMANVTLAIDDDLLRLARVKAVRQGTTVNAVVRGWLDEWVHDDAQGATVDALLALARDVGGSPLAAKWRREDLHDR